MISDNSRSDIQLRRAFLLLPDDTVWDLIVVYNMIVSRLHNLVTIGTQTRFVVNDR